MTSGSFWFFYMFDICEAIDLDALRRTLGIVPGTHDPGTRHSSREYVRFERPPVVAQIPEVVLENGDRLRATAEYYDYGVISIAFELPFAIGWPELVAHSSHLRDTPEIERHANRQAKECLARVSSTLLKPRENWLSEEYHLVHVNSGQEPAADLIRSHAGDIARIVRGEATELSPGEVDDVLRSGISYYPTDLLVGGWSAAFLCDTPEGARPVMQLLQYANTQLLEYRYYDHMLTLVLDGVYRSLERVGFLARWRLAREANRLNRIRLDVRELTERTDTSIKFLSDMFSARVYKLAAEKVGAHDYRRLVDNKLETAADLYQFMTEQFHQGRAFVLELIVVVILIIDLVVLFRDQK